MLVVLVWFAASAFGGLPFLFTPHYASFTDTFFETASGFTTTGATVLADVEVLPEPIQFWRCFTHWIGGMGIVLLVIAILPVVGHGGMLLYRAEFSGARSDRLKPRIAETALALWKIYVALSIAEFVALRLAGMSPFDAICHTFATLGTGGILDEDRVGRRVPEPGRRVDHHDLHVPGRHELRPALPAVPGAAVAQRRAGLRDSRLYAAHGAVHGGGRRVARLADRVRPRAGGPGGGVPGGVDWDDDRVRERELRVVDAA